MLCLEKNIAFAGDNLSQDEAVCKERQCVGGNFAVEYRPDLSNEGNLHMTCDPTIITKLNELQSAIGEYPDPRRASAEWKQVYKLLQKTDVPPGRITSLVGMRNMEGLAEVIGGLAAPETDVPEPADDAPDSETCKKALKAFRKREAVTRLDDESKLGRSPLSKGAGSSSMAISPPMEWPDEVWRELARQGKLRDVGGGFYELAK